MSTCRPHLCRVSARNCENIGGAPPRRQEIGIRLALGAERADILRLVLRQGLLLSVAGIAAGLLLALAFTRLLGSLLYQVGTHDLATFLLAPWLLLLLALPASFLPARRAMRVSPIESPR